MEWYKNFAADNPGKVQTKPTGLKYGALSPCPSWCKDLKEKVLRIFPPTLPEINMSAASHHHTNFSYYTDFYSYVYRALL
jgi:hypothetical protein